MVLDHDAGVAAIARRPLALPLLAVGALPFRIPIESAGQTTRIVVIGDEAWLSAGGSDLMPAPGTFAQQTAESFDLLPLMSQFPEGFEAMMETVGPEERNGVATTHYHVDADSPAGQLASIPPGGSFDVWLADAGYVVALEASGVGTGDNALDSFSLDITNVNDPANTVERPG